MLNTEELTQADLDRLNKAIRGANVGTSDIAEIATALDLGEATVKRWFDATNGGDYSPCIPGAAIGKEMYFLKEADVADEPPDRGRYPQAPDAYQSEGPPDDYDEQGISDPSDENLYLRILLGSLLAEGFEREASSPATPPNQRETFSGVPHDYQLNMSTVWQAVEYCREVMAGQESRWKTMAWISFDLAFDATDGWLLHEIDNWQANDDPSP